MGGHRQAALDGLFGQEPGGDQDGGVGRVRATGDGGQDDGSVSEGVGLSFVSDLMLALELGFWNSESLESNFIGEALQEIFLDFSKWDSVMWSLGSRDAGING